MLGDAEELETVSYAVARKCLLRMLTFAEISKMQNINIHSGTKTRTRVMRNDRRSFNYNLSSFVRV